MECKIAQYWISLYLDNDLEEEAAERLFEHIDGCEACRDYMEKSMEMHQITKEAFDISGIDHSHNIQSIMEDVRNQNVSFQSRKKNWSAIFVASALVLLILVTPIKNKVVLAHVNEWVKSLTIMQKDVVIEVETRDDSYITSRPDGRVIKEKVDKQYFKTAEEFQAVAKTTENKPCIPPYMLPDFSFEYGIYGKHDDKMITDFYFETFYIKQSNTSPTDSILVKLNYLKPDGQICGHKSYISESEKAMEVEVDGEKGVIIKRGLNTTYDTYETLFILNKYGVTVEIAYKVVDKNKDIASEIVSIAEPLIQQIKKEVPEVIPQIKSVSKVIESSSEAEFQTSIAGIDDRIVRIDSIPEGYLFEKGIFIDNPKEITADSLSSDYVCVYAKGQQKLTVTLQLYTHTTIGSDFLTYSYGEVEKREVLGEYTLKIYKDRPSRDKATGSRMIGIDLPDYAINLNIRCHGEQDELMPLEDMKVLAEAIIEETKKQASKRQSISIGAKVKAFDSIKDFISSEDIQKADMPIPTYIPRNERFMRAKYDQYGYLLQLERATPDLTTTIRVAKDDLFHQLFGLEDQQLSKVMLSGEEASIVIGRRKHHNGSYEKEVTLKIRLKEKGLTLAISQTFLDDEEVSTKEVIRIAQSMLK